MTIYSNPGHMYMAVAGLRFDTTGRASAGTRWQTELRSTSGSAAPKHTTTSMSDRLPATPSHASPPTGAAPAGLLRASFCVLQLIDGFAGTREHAGGRNAVLLHGAGFGDARRYQRDLRTVWETLELLEARLVASAR